MPKKVANKLYMVVEHYQGCCSSLSAALGSRPYPVVSKISNCIRWIAPGLDSPPWK